MKADAKKRRIIIVIAAIAAVAVVTGAVLLGIWLGTRADVLALTGMQTYYPPSESYVTVDRGFDYYLGHPDLVYFKGKLITAYPLGHGKGQIAMKTSSDLGKTWDPIDETELPESFKYSQETPTLYKLEFTDGTEKVLLVSGCPSWSDDDEYYANGFNFSLSDDGVNYVASGTVPDDKNTYAKILKFGKDAIVLSPDSLKRTVTKMCEEFLLANK